jgi:hypothetical protein
VSQFSQFSHAIRRAVLAASALVVGALLALGMSVPAEAHVAPVATITGKVTAPNGHGLAGISVRPYFFDGSNWTAVDDSATTTTSSGSYNLSSLEPGSYRIGFNENAADSYLVDYTGNVSVLDAAVSLFVGDNAAATVNARLVLGGTLSGKATYLSGAHTVGANNIEPIARPLLPNGLGGFAGVNPNVSYVGRETTTSGAWTVPGLPTGTYVVDLHDTTGAPNSRTLDGYIGSSGPVVHAANAQRFAVTAGHTTTRAGSTQLTLASAGVDAPLVVTVQQPSSSAAVEGATVTLRSTDDANFFWSSSFDLGPGTDSNGQVTIPHVATGAYELTVTDPTYQPYVEDFTYNSASPTKVIQLAELNPLGWQDDIVPSVVGDTDVDGNTTVGTVLGLANDQLNQDGGTVTFEWLRGGTPIYGQTTDNYTVKAGDIGASISVLVTGSKWGFDDVSHEAAIGGQVVAGPQITAGATSPSIVPAETVGYGSTLVVSPGTWSVSGATISIDWMDEDGELAHDTVSYKPALNDIGKNIYALVTASKAGYEDSEQVATASVLVNPGSAPTLVKAPVVTSHKLANGGVQFTASAATWSLPGIVTQALWADDGSEVDATQIALPASVTIPKADASHAIRLIFIGIADGYADSSIQLAIVRKGTEAPLMSYPGGVQDAADSSPVAATTPVATGTVLTAASDPEEWSFPDGSYNEADTFQWYRQLPGHGAAKISGATHATYTVGAADVGVTLTVHESASAADYSAPTAVVAAGLGSLAALGTEDISISFGAYATAGITATTHVDTHWNVTGVSRVGKWMSCAPSPSVDCSDASKFTAIAHATGSSYVTQPSQRGRVLLYRVVASKAGFASVTTDSTHVQLSSTDAQIRATTTPALPSPYLHEPARVETKITAAPAHFDIAGVSVGYQWKVCDSVASDCGDQVNWHAASGAGSKTVTYAPTSADLGSEAHLIEFSETASRTGFISDTEVSGSTSIAAAVARGAAPSVNPIGITGDTFGQTLSIAGADAFTYPVSATPIISYRWTVNGKPITGATASSFVPTASEVGTIIGVKVRAVDPGFADGVYSSTVELLAAGEIPGNPAIVPGTGIVPGTTLSVNTSSYPAGPTFTYQWEVKTGASLWANIVGATKATYVVTPANAGSQIKVDVRARVAGHIVGALSAPAVNVGYSLDLESTSPPVLTGTGEAGSALAVSTGSWSATGLTFAYQWYRNGVAIPGAIFAIFAPLEGSVGDDLSATVTASHPGFETRTAASATVTVTEPR